MSWKAAGDTGVHGYRFSYDEMSRLTAAGICGTDLPAQTMTPPTRITGRATLTSPVVTDAQALHRTA